MTKFNKNYWAKRYQAKQTGWDIGYASTPIKNYIDQLENKDLKILIPGAGNAYEAAYLFDNGFKNTYVLDIAQEPLDNLKKRSEVFPENQLINEDFFNHKVTYDLIIEQTFFCALSPELRANYAKKMHELLHKNGKLVGLLFDFPLTEKGPPFGGSTAEYLRYFEPYFHIKVLAKSYNSIKPRQGNELFIIFTKK